MCYIRGVIRSLNVLYYFHGAMALVEIPLGIRMCYKKFECVILFSWGDGYSRDFFGKQLYFVLFFYLAVSIYKNKKVIIITKSTEM